MERDIVGTVFAYVLLGVGLLSVVRFALMEAGSFWKWLRNDFRRML